MSLKLNGDDYVRVPLPNQFGHNTESDTDLDGVVEPRTQAVDQTPNQPPNIWNFAFYQQHFNVDTIQVLRRLTHSVIPNPRADFLQHVLKPYPDLYGPFWIATTLILASAVGGNVSSYLQSLGRISSWHYDFRKVTLASTIIYAYWWLMPLGIVAFSYLRSKQSRSSTAEPDQDPLMDYSQESNRARRTPGSLQAANFVELLSVFGYSFAVFVPVSVFWTIPSVILQWLLVIIAMVVSSAFLTFALLPMFRKQHSKLAGPLIITIIALQCVFSIGLMFTFFRSSPTLPVDSPVVALPGQQAELPEQIKKPNMAKRDSELGDDTQNKSNESAVT